MTTTEEKIAKLREKQAQLKAQEKQLLAKEREKERKARTKRLIEIGGTVESVLGRPIEKEDLPLLIAFLQRQGTHGNYFLNAMKRKPEAVLKTDYFTRNDNVNDFFEE